MHILIISSSLDKSSRSRQLAKLCKEQLETASVQTSLADLAELNIPNFDNDTIYQTDIYHDLHSQTVGADGLILCSPVYNWGLSAELKKYIEYVGSTPPDRTLNGALFDKVVTFVTAGGLPHSYTAFRDTASALMLDFKCVINPYHLYVHKRHWDDDTLSAEKTSRLEKTLAVMMELCHLLAPRTYRSKWEL